MDTSTLNRATGRSTPFSCGLPAALAVAGAAVWAQPVDARSIRADAFDDALAQYETCHWPQAYAAFARLADAGDARAARVALLMHAHGPRLFAQAFEVKAVRLEHWRDLGASGLRVAKD